MSVFIKYYIFYSHYHTNVRSISTLCSKTNISLSVTRIRRCSWAVVPPTRRWTARYVDCLTILYFPSVLLYKNTYLYSIRKPTLRFLPYILDDIIGLYYPFKLRRIAWYVDCLIIFYFLYALVNKHTTHIISEN
jgi:hypothetical protein